MFKKLIPITRLPLPAATLPAPTGLPPQATVRWA